MKIKNFAHKVLNTGGDVFQKEIIAKCSRSKVIVIEQRTGIDIRGYNHVIDSNGVRHVFIKHFDPVKEKARGLINVTLNDFDKIPEVLNNFDDVKNGGKSKTGHDVLIYVKRINGHIIYIEEIRSVKVREAVLHTMYIKPRKV